jgi:hypothetical protein
MDKLLPQHDASAPSDADLLTIERRSIRTGAIVARVIFNKRGNHSEAHISETELASICAYAFQLGAEWGLMK